MLACHFRVEYAQTLQCVWARSLATSILRWSDQLPLFRQFVCRVTISLVPLSWQSHCKSSPGSCDNVEQHQMAADPQTKPTWAVSPLIGCYHLHSLSPCSVTQLKNWHLFYHPTEGTRLFLHLCQFSWKSIKKCDCESAHRQTHTPTDWQTQTGFIICPMLYAIAMGQIITRYKDTANLQ